MLTYVGLLRGVNVGGKNKMPMADLRNLVASIGYSEVSTYIQSGNVIFSSEEPVVPATLELAIAERFGFATTVILRTGRELEAAIEANPFADLDLSKVHVGFMHLQPTPAAVATLEVDRFLPEQFAVTATEMYLYLPSGMARTKVPDYLIRRLGVATTLRNWNSVTTLVELTRASAGPKVVGSPKPIKK
jgi:uncharacterized protein (DUF1697 family)